MVASTRPRRTVKLPCAPTVPMEKAVPGFDVETPSPVSSMPVKPTPVRLVFCCTIRPLARSVSEPAARITPGTGVTPGASA